MKKSILFIALLLLTFIACSEENSIVNPSSNFKNENNYLTKIAGDSVDIITIDTTFYKKIYSKELTVNGEKGGKINFQHMFKNKRDKMVILNATLTIPENAYQGDLTFDLIFDLEILGVELYPSPFTFDKPVILDLQFTNADLKEFDLKDFNFDYLDGNPENLNYDRIIFNIESGLLKIMGAQIPHFSRYGWTRTK